MVPKGRVLLNQGIVQLRGRRRCAQGHGAGKAPRPAGQDLLDDLGFGHITAMMLIDPQGGRRWNGVSQGVPAASGP